jgi:hypothetical protein
VQTAEGHVAFVELTASNIFPSPPRVFCGNQAFELFDFLNEIKKDLEDQTTFVFIECCTPTYLKVYKDSSKSLRIFI